MIRRLVATSVLAATMGLGVQVGTAAADIQNRHGFRLCAEAARVEYRARLNQTNVSKADAKRTLRAQLRRCHDRFL